VIFAYSENIAVQSISAALSEISAVYSKGAKSVHIIVSAVFQLGNVWKAIVRVAVEPDLEKIDIHYEATDTHDLELDS